MGARLAGVGLWLGVQFAVPLLAISAVGLAAASATAAELAEIQARGYLIVAVKDNWYPMGFRSESGDLVGFEIDIARRLAEDLLGDPSAVVFEPVANVDRVNVVVAGEVDLAIASVTVTALRQRIAVFSEPYYLDGTGFVTRAPAIRTLTDLEQARIALLNNSSTVSPVRYALPQATLVPVSSYRQALALLETGAADVFAGDVTVLSGWQQQDRRYRLLDEVISAEPLAIVLPKGTRYTPLRRQVNQLVRSWYDEGWLQERAAFWGLPPERSLSLLSTYGQSSGNVRE